MGQAADRNRSDCLDDRPPLRGRLRAARLEHDKAEDHHRAFPPAAPGCRSARSVLSQISAVIPVILRRIYRALRIALRRGHHGWMSRNGTAARLPLQEEIARPTFRRERSALKRGVWPVAGCDEAGRGPLAGPVVAAAVVLDPDDVPRGLDDSKRLTPERREVLYERICARAHVAVAMAPPWRIDRDNILR